MRFRTAPDDTGKTERPQGPPLPRFGAAALALRLLPPYNWVGAE
jgi:hypothetical protein